MRGTVTDPRCEPPTLGAVGKDQFRLSPLLGSPAGPGLGWGLSRTGCFASRIVVIFLLLYETPQAR